MTYQEFRDSPEAKLPQQWYRVTAESRTEDLCAIVLQWEPTNAKWYKPEPFDEREETGYTNEIWFDSGRNWLIVDIRPL